MDYLSLFIFVILSIYDAEKQYGCYGNDLYPLWLSSFRSKRENICMLDSLFYRSIVTCALYDSIRICHFGCSPLSESASTVGAGLAVPAVQSGYMPVAEVFKLAVSSFKVNDWNLFGSVA